MLAAVGHVYPFGDNSFLTGDLKYQYIDFFAWFRRVLLGEANLRYSFSQGLGMNTWGLYSYYLASPLQPALRAVSRRQADALRIRHSRAQAWLYPHQQRLVCAKALWLIQARGVPAFRVIHVLQLDRQQPTQPALDRLPDSASRLRLRFAELIHKSSEWRALSSPRRLTSRSAGTRPISAFCSSASLYWSNLSITLPSRALAGSSCSTERFDSRAPSCSGCFCPPGPFADHPCHVQGRPRPGPLGPLLKPASNRSSGAFSPAWGEQR